jgi:hypothetical protein
VIPRQPRLKSSSTAHIKQSAEVFAVGGGVCHTQSSEGAEKGHDPGTSRHVQAHEAFAEPPQNRCETGEAAGFSEFPESGEGFAEPGFHDTPRDRARAAAGAQVLMCRHFRPRTGSPNRCPLITAAPAPMARGG